MFFRIRKSELENRWYWIHARNSSYGSLKSPQTIDIIAI